MIKLISTDHLQPGMFIHDLNCSWMDHPFLTKSFRVRDWETVEKVVALGIRKVYIDTIKGADTWLPVKEEINAEIDRSQQELAQRQAVKPASVDLKDEAARARRLHAEANRVSKMLLESARMGCVIEIERVIQLADHMVESVFRHQDALLPIARLKNLDDYNFEHSVGVGALLIAFGRAMKLPKETIRDLAIGGLLMDIGKAKVPPEVLNKPGKLSEAEFSMMKSHVAESLRILQGVQGLSEVTLKVVAEHHERVDGSGYPRGLKGDQLSVYGQMAAIADVFDAITAHKVYQRGMEPTSALKKLNEWSKTQFDPQLVQTFVRMVGIYPTGSLVRLESNRLAVVIQQNERSLLEPIVRVIYHATKQHYLPPEIVDLTKIQDRIASFESFEKWKIDPNQWLAI